MPTINDRDAVGADACGPVFVGLSGHGRPCV